MATAIVRRPQSFSLHSFQGIYTVAPEMMDFFSQLEKAARSQAPVLIRGETGTGKELVARAIHQLSRRSTHRLDAVNCASLSADMLSSELFGHVKGAYTGAVSDRRGLLRQVNKGTLFLDEIAEMPLDIQARLLRVLQEKSFTPMGSSERVDVDVRFISATHVALRRAVENRQFRADLLFRIRVLPIFLPPLRERTGDILALTWFFVDALSRNEGDFAIRGITPGVRDAFLNYDWPGNVRELRNVVEYALVMATSDVIDLQGLPPELRGEGPVDAHHKIGELADNESERETIRLALIKARGDREKAADILSMSRSTLWRKMKEHQLKWPRKKRKKS